MKNKKKNKITFEVRRQISELVNSLPTVPYFIKNKDGKSTLTYVKVTKFTGYKDVKIKTDPITGKQTGLSYSTSFQRRHEARVLNHKVELTSAYEADGQAGIDLYVGYVKNLAVIMEKEKELELERRKKKKVVVNEEYAGPLPQDFGMDDKGVWVVEGGEEAFNKALAEWEESQKGKMSKELVEHGADSGQVKPGNHLKEVNESNSSE